MSINTEKILLEIGDKIIQELQNKLEENKPSKDWNSIASGKGSNSLYGSFQKKVSDNVLSITTDKDYAEYVDEGRPPGAVNHWAIDEWVRKRGIRGRSYKGRYQSYTAASIAISRSIKNRGYEGINFVSRSFLKVTDFIQDIVAERYAKAIEKRIEPGLKLR